MFLTRRGGAHSAKWRNRIRGRDAGRELVSSKRTRRSNGWKPPRSRCLVPKIKFATTDERLQASIFRATKTSRRRGEKAGSGNRNSRRPRAFAGITK
ncbi:PREDICTED: uncharacterized protein LOC105462411 isoform X2 [Wasmannia auropunctata]|uniref:uncharacterized protein LOC105462411 isoform X2 n=1 Tax=Wasmannia auropunctata TaxID=64793 RepID=UPI0005F05343|nr:PREDICTED: uncharacterized protein LOC105462411 isoform X2 [Wasmannia auropunctata]